MSRLESKEQILLDTTGAPSILGIEVRATGDQADLLRHAFETEGESNFAAQRLELCRHRFSSASRIGLLEYRDEQAQNEVLLAEKFEIQGLSAQGSHAGTNRLLIADYLLHERMIRPESDDVPLTLLFPQTIFSSIQVKAVGITHTGVDRKKIANDFLEFTRIREVLHHSWTVTWELSSLAPGVPPDRLAEYLQGLEAMKAELAFELFVPKGHAKPVQRVPFGVLPPKLEPSQTEGSGASVSCKPRIVAPNYSSSQNQLRPIATGASLAFSRTSAAATGATSSSASAVSGGAKNPARMRPESDGAVVRAEPRSRRRKKRKKWNLLWPAILLALLVAAALGWFAALKFVGG